MPRRRYLKNLPPNVYAELYHWCLQYPNWKEQLHSCYYLQAPALSDMPRNGSTTNLVERAADKADLLRSRIQLVDSTIQSVYSEEDWRVFRRNIIYGERYAALYAQYGLRVSEASFKKARRSFFYELAKAKHRI